VGPQGYVRTCSVQRHQQNVDLQVKVKLTAHAEQNAVGVDQEADGRHTGQPPDGMMPDTEDSLRVA
jgi:hypothetical protein